MKLPGIDPPASLLKRFWLALPAAGLYLLTLTRDPSADSILYAISIETGSWQSLADAYHILLALLGWAWYHLWQLVGYRGQALLPLQTLDALAGGLCAALVSDLARRLSGSARIGLWAGAGFAVSGGAWLLSVDAELVPVGLAALLLGLAIFLPVDLPQITDRRRIAWLGFVSGLATLVYLSNAALILIIPAILWTRRSEIGDPEHEPFAWRKPAGVYLFSAALPLSAVYLAWLLANISLGETLHSLAANYLWATPYAAFSGRDLLHGGYTLLRSLALCCNLGLSDSTQLYLATLDSAAKLLFAGYYLLILGLAALPLLALWRRRSGDLYLQSIWPQQKTSLLALGLLAAISAALAWLWVPGDLSFWLPVLAVWWLIAGIALAQIGRPSSRRRAGPAGLVILFLLTANAALVILPETDADRNPDYMQAQAIAGRTQEQDFLLNTYNYRGTLYLLYFHQRQVSYLEATPDMDVQNEANNLGGIMRNAIAQGNKVYILSAGEPPTSIRALIGLVFAKAPDAPCWTAAFQTGDLTAWEVLP